MIKKTLLSLLVLSVVLLFTSTIAFAQSLVIPGMIESELYNNGGQGIGYSTTDGSAPVTETNTDSPGNGLHVAYIDAGEWLAYTVNAAAGYYNINVRVAKDPSAPAGGAFHIEIGGVDVTGTQTVPSTGGWTTFATMVIGPIEVTTTGSVLVKMAFDGGPFNLNWMSFVSTSDSPSPSPSPTPAPTVSPNPPLVSPLHVEGQWIKDDSGNNVTLHGVAIGDLHAIYQGDRKTDSTQATAITVQDIIDKGSTSDWHIDVWRLPVHADVNDETGHHGWNVVNNPQWFFDNIIDPAVSKVISVGKYAIVDWHYVGVSWDDATVIAKTEEFWLGNGTWTGIAAHYANNPNVLFELFNEPGGGTWSSWQTRATGWINRIRGVGANNIIIVGGPNWSQVLPQSSADLISATNIAYACHIYPAHVSGSVPNWIEFASANAPVVMTEWGFENTGPAPVSGTAAAYGATYKAYLNSKPNVSWVAWCFDYIYHSYMFDTNWTLLGNGNATASTLYFGASGVDKGVHGITAPSDTSENFMGQFTKNWLAEAANAPTSAPTTVPTAGPTSAPTAVPTAAPTVAPTSVPTAAPTAVPTLVPTAIPTGVPTGVPTAVPTQAPTAIPTAVPTAGPTAIPGGLKIQYKCGDAAASVQSIKPYFNIVNSSGSAINLNTLTLKYWYTKEGSATEAASVYFATPGSSKVVPAFGTGFYQIGFTADAGTLNAGASCEIQSGFNKADWTNYDQPSDWGFTPADTSYTDDQNITLYQNGVLVWGTEPTGTVTAAPTAVPTAGPTAVPTAVPTGAPTQAPTAVPTAVPTLVPTGVPTAVPTAVPTGVPGSCTTVTATGVTMNTTGAFCFQTQSVINGWGGSNCDGRTVSVTVNGTGTPVTVIGASLPAKQPTDYYVFQWSAGTYSYAYVFWW